MHVSTLRMLELFFRGFVYICCLEFYKKSVVTNFLEIESIWFIRLKISCQNEVILFLISLLVILAGLFGSIRNNAYLPKYQEKVIFFLLSMYWVQNDIHRWWTLSVWERTISGIRKGVRVTSLHLLYWRPFSVETPACILRFRGSHCGMREKDYKATATDSSVSINHPFVRLPQAVSVFAFWEKSRPEADQAKNLRRWHS